MTGSSNITNITDESDLRLILSIKKGHLWGQAGTKFVLLKVSVSSKNAGPY